MYQGDFFFCCTTFIYFLFWNVRFYRDFHERELEAAFLSLSSFNLRSLGVLGVTLLIGVSMGMASLILGPITITFGVHLPPIFRGRVFGKLRFLRGWHFFVWTAVHGQILTLDNLMLRGRILVNWCCMCHHNEETVDHLLLHCPVAHSLWVYMY